MLAESTTGLMQTGAGVAAVLGAFEFAKWAWRSKAGGAPRGNNAQSTLCRNHAERLASLETSRQEIKDDLRDLKDKSDCIDGKLNRLLTLSSRGPGLGARD